jgi:hypothetical protein
MFEKIKYVVEGTLEGVKVLLNPELGCLLTDFLKII